MMFSQKKKQRTCLEPWYRYETFTAYFSLVESFVLFWLSIRTRGLCWWLLTISTTLPKYSSPFFFFPKAYCLVASINRTGILYTRLLKNATRVYGCLESWPELFRIRNDPSLLDLCKASSADLRSQAPAYQGLPSSSASWSANVELNGKLWNGPSAAGLPASGNLGKGTGFWWTGLKGRNAGYMKGRTQYRIRRSCTKG